MYTPAGRENPLIRSRAESEDRSRAESESRSQVRVFFAVRPPPDLRRAVGAYARIAAHETRGRAVPDDNLHLTLVFVGDIVASTLPPLSRIGASVAARCGGVTLVLDRLDGFARARVAWLGPAAVPKALVALAHVLERELDAAGVAYDRRPFRAHVTVARSCRGPYVACAIDPLAWRVDSLVLLRSPRGVSGGRYETIGSWALGPGLV